MSDHAITASSVWKPLIPGAAARKVNSIMFKNGPKGLVALALTGVIVASSACGVDSSTGSAAARDGASAAGISSFAPAPSKILYGIPDGVYKFKVEAGKAASLNIGGTSRLDIPEDGICDLATSGYGPSTWDAPCSPTKQDVDITVTSTGAGTSNPKLDFVPALRFNPSKSVRLSMYGRNVTDADAASWVIKYCTLDAAGVNNCVNESVNDASLKTYIDSDKSVAFRRIKHFSEFLLGYVILD